LLLSEISIYAIAARDGAITRRMSTRSDTLLSSRSIPLTVPLNKRFRAREEARDVNLIDIKFLNEISNSTRARIRYDVINIVRARAREKERQRDRETERVPPRPSTESGLDNFGRRGAMINSNADARSCVRAACQRAKAAAFLRFCLRYYGGMTYASLIKASRKVNLWEK